MRREAAQSFGPDDIFELLLEKLNRRGILLVQIPRFIKDVTNILSENGSLSEDEVNSRMVRLGWGEQVLNGYILELIRFLAENPRNLVKGIEGRPGRSAFHPSDASGWQPA
jgi:hypothetical protein